MNTLPRLGLAAAVLMLSACAQRPVLRQPDPVVQPAALVPAQFPAGAAATTGPSIAGLDWSAYFADARLRELIGLALQHNRDLQAAGLNIEWHEFMKPHTIAGEEEMRVIRKFVTNGTGKV